MSAQLRAMQPSPRVALSYALDWIIIIVIAAIGAGISKVEPNHRPFSLVDRTISFPYVEKEKVSTSVLFVVSLIVPAIIITLVSLVFVPSKASPTLGSRAQTWRSKLWEWNVGWMGLALGYAVTALFTNGMKLLIGKPRPDLLSRCNPDFSNISSHMLGGFNDTVSEGTLVSWTICQESDQSKLKDGFQSFPSGHASFGFAGFVYLALFLCAKFAVRLPYLWSQSTSQNDVLSSAFSANATNDSGDSTKHLQTLSREGGVRPSHDEAAAPPTYLLILPLTPICVATYIATTRFSDFRHHGFDILFGALLGIVISWASFRMYHLPVRRGSGWAWRARSASRAFGIPIGTSGYVEQGIRRKRSDDIELAQSSDGNGKDNIKLGRSSNENGKST